MFSAASTALTIGSNSTEVLSRMVPVSGASRARIGNGCGHTVGWETQCWPMETHAYPMREAAATTAMASSMMRVAPRSVGLQNGVRWNPIFMRLVPYGPGLDPVNRVQLQPSAIGRTTSISTRS